MLSRQTTAQEEGAQAPSTHDLLGSYGLTDKWHRLDIPPGSPLIDRSVAQMQLLDRFGIELTLVAHGEEIPGSYWGESEAGLRGSRLYARADTPLHSLLHEASHFICMSPARRVALEREAGGDDAEEAAVCYLQVLLADVLPGVGRARLMQDMDAWGYSFRLGSTRAWFEGDAGDACAWLRAHGIASAAGALTGPGPGLLWVAALMPGANCSSSSSAVIPTSSDSRAIRLRNSA